MQILESLVYVPNPEQTSLCPPRFFFRGNSGSAYLSVTVTHAGMESAASATKTEP